MPRYCRSMNRLLGGGVAAVLALAVACGDDSGGDDGSGNNSGAGASGTTSTEGTTSSGNACGELSFECESASDCCGSVFCENQRCCAGPAQPCQNSNDCCSGYCVTGSDGNTSCQSDATTSSTGGCANLLDPCGPSTTCCDPEASCQSSAGPGTACCYPDGHACNNDTGGCCSLICLEGTCQSGN